MFNYPVGKTCVQCWWYDDEARKADAEGGICFETQPQVIAIPQHKFGQPNPIWQPAHIENGVRAKRRACSKFVSVEEVHRRGNPS